ncbi:MAG: ATP-binding protein [Anaerolineaceae bacterium]
MDYNTINASSSSQDSSIGYVVGGGLEANLQVRLTVPPQEVQEGAFVIMDSSNWRFYGLVTDLQLGSTDPRFADEQSETRLPAHLNRLLQGQTLFTNLAVMPALMMDRGPEPGSPTYDSWRALHADEMTPIPVKTVPNHHARVKLADQADIAEIFGEENGKEIFRVGETREQGHGVCLNLDRLIQRSSGIFGTTGSGKSFLARMILAGLIHTDHASTLIFDMHNEYGPDSTASDTGKPAPGLAGKFSNVRLVGLGAGTDFGSMQAHFNLEIPFSDITTEDILQLSQSLNLRETTATTLDALVTSFHKDWFKSFLDLKYGAVEEDENGKKVPAPDSVAYWAEHAGINVLAAEGLYSKLGRVFKLPYLKESPASNGLDDIITNLEAGRHVVLSFGSHDSDLDYLLVTNLITRKIRDAWEARTNAFHKDKSRNKEPRPLVIVVEEAHKLLNREMANQTIFSTIAREMRKYYVTLLVIDQRPSQIYDEVMSQLGTRISASLGDEDDIAAVLSGLAGRQALRGMLAKLQPKEEVLMLGWGVPMPIPIRSRRYDEKFWVELLGEPKPALSMKEGSKILGFGDDDTD